AAPYQFEIAAPKNVSLFSGGGLLALSPDGRQLVFVATPAGGKPLLYLRPLDSVEARPLVGTTGAAQPFWSPDSRSVAFMADGKLKKIEIASAAVQTICDVQGTAGTWSRNGDILFRSDVSRSIERVAAAGGRPVPIVPPDPARGELWVNWPQF